MGTSLQCKKCNHIWVEWGDIVSCPVCGEPVNRSDIDGNDGTNGGGILSNIVDKIFGR